MCCLFGLLDCGGRLTGRQKGRLVRALALESEARGTDAAGIAYNSGGSLRIYKRPGPAHQLNFFIPEDAHAIMGHSRMTTQGKAKRNRNNHPFAGKVPGKRFALAHNGVLYNDRALQRERKLPRTGIETDSYVAVQLIEQQRALTPDSLKYMAESVEGSFVFTVLDDKDTLTFVKGDNPLCLLHFPGPDLYVYASTEEILRKALNRTWLGRMFSTEVEVDGGDILTIRTDGSRRTDRFRQQESWPFYGWYPPPVRYNAQSHYLRTLKSVASTFGYSPAHIDAMLDEGWTTDEIEEALYETGML